MTSKVFNVDLVLHGSGIYKVRTYQNLNTII